MADNASTDSTASLAASRGCRVVSVEKRVIAAARNGGARAARGEIVCFVDADTRIHPETFRAIDEALATGRVVGGATGVRLERWSAGIAVAYMMLVPLVWVTGIDTGLVFCRKEDFDAVGGYNENLLIAEDVAFPWALKRLGRRRGQRLVRLRRFKATASCGSSMSMATGTTSRCFRARPFSSSSGAKPSSISSTATGIAPAADDRRSPREAGGASPSPTNARRAVLILS